MSTSFSPDLNVWIALAHLAHPHHESAEQWLRNLLPEARLVFCRTTEVSFLRLLTTPPVMGSRALTQTDAWDTLDGFLSDPRTVVMSEPKACWAGFRAHTQSRQASPKLWADAYLAAFALSAKLRLVTFDRALAASVPGALLLTIQ